MSKTIFQLWIATAALPKLKFQTNKHNKFYSISLLCSLIVKTKSIYININDEKDPIKTELMEKNGHLSQNSKLYLSLAIEDHIQPAESVSLLLHPRGPVRCLREAVSGRVVTNSQNWPNTDICSVVTVSGVTCDNVALQHRVPLWTQGSWHREIRRTEQKWQFIRGHYGSGVWGILPPPERQCPLPCAASQLGYSLLHQEDLGPTL